MDNQIVKISPELLEMMGSKLPNSLQPFSREIFLLDIIVAGTTHCPQIAQVYPHLKKGMVLRMQRQPTNKHDKNAIAILYEKIRIGYVPRELNLIISRLMDAGKAFFCRIEDVELVDNYWVKINSKIYMVE
ncbi:HIRAN domain-containing protein [Prevotella aff. ruminicola Tc2-24]|uniref:HIRAN domain-containing protein n=1 Tax=Prevotella aff. ruminicola Tc2-24 TaxID=81582 RepID=A0A1I0MC46_9BACT|nr:HIRAN domain-containing protein [Prevotella aff. ruminicola Tc2-24]SEV86065.1 HIRAN domain-containing protein [Prevotella aff. ruminicola Tc2-24]